MTDWRSTLGYYTFEEGNLVSRSSKKQLVVPQSSAEAKLQAMVHGICEMQWISGFFRELGFNSPGPAHLYCDSKVAISIAHSVWQNKTCQGR